MQTVHIRSLYFLIFLYTTILTLFIGISFGWILQNSFINLLASLFPHRITKPGFYPLVVTCLTAFICQMGFIYPHILKLLSISPMSILKDSISFNQQSISVLLAGLLAFYALLYLYTEQPILSFYNFCRCHRSVDHWNWLYLCIAWLKRIRSWCY